MNKYSIEYNKFIVRKVNFEKDHTHYLGPILEYELDAIQNARNILKSELSLDFPKLNNVSINNRPKETFLKDDTDVLVRLTQSDPESADLWNLFSQFYTVCYLLRWRPLVKVKNLPIAELDVLITRLKKFQREGFELYPPNSKLIEILEGYSLQVNFFTYIMKIPKGGRPLDPEPWLLRKLLTFDIYRLKTKMTERQIILLMFAYGVWLPKQDTNLEELVVKISPAVQKTLSKQQKKVFEFNYQRSFTEIAKTQTLSKSKS